MSNQIRLKRGSGSDPSASDLVVGEVALRTDNGKLFTKKDDNSIAEIGTGVTDGDKGDITVSSSGATFTIDNGVIDNANINASAAIAGTKISPDFGSQNIVTTGQVQLNGSYPRINLHDSNSENDFSIRNNNGQFMIHDDDRDQSVLNINNDGTTDVKGRLDAEAGLDVTGNITVSGTVDGVDVAALNTTVSGKLSNIVEDTSPQLGNSLDMNGQSINGGDSAGVANNRIKLGASDDLQIYHDGTHARFHNSTGLISMKASGYRFNDALGIENCLDIDANGAVSLYYDHSIKFETISGGAKITGSLGLGTNPSQAIHTHTGSVSGALEVQSNGSNNYFAAIQSAGDFANGSTVGGLVIRSQGGIEFTGNDGASVQMRLNSNGNLDIPVDSKKLRLGASQNLEIYNNSNTAFLHHTTGGIKVSVAGGSNQVQINKGVVDEHMAKFIADVAVELYYDNSKKFETTSAGIAVTGSVEPTGHIKLGDNSFVYFGAGVSTDLYIGHEPSSSRHLFRSGDGATKMVFQGGSETMMVLQPQGAVELYYDNSKKLETTANGVELVGNLHFHDSEYALFGNANDLQIYHNGTHSFIQDTGTGNLEISSSKVAINNAANNANMATFTDGGAVDLYHNGTKKLQTDSAGTVFLDDTFLGDNLKANFGASADLQIYHDGSNSYLKHISSGTGDLLIFADGHETEFINVSGEHSAKMKPNGAVELYYDNSKKLETTNNGIEITGDLRFDSSVSGGTIRLQDAQKIFLGGGNDLQIFHDGTNTNIQNSTGVLYVAGNTVSLTNSAIDEVYFKGSANGAAELFYDNSKKFETTSTGINIPASVPTITLSDTDGNTPYSRITAGGGDLVFEADQGDEEGNTLMLFRVDDSEKMRLDANGNLGLGTTSLIGNSSSIYLTVNGSSLGGIALKSGDSTQGYLQGSGGTVTLSSDGSKNIRFDTNGSQRMNIASDGNVGIGKTSSSIDVDGAIFTTSGQNLLISKSGSGGKIITLNRRTNVGLSIEFFRGSSVGSISHNNTSTAYNTSSDYRLKENVVALSDGITRLKTLKPYRFNFIADKDVTVDGFLAHEVTAVPEAVTGTKDAVITQEMIDNEDYEKERLGEILPQGIDQSKLVPLLVAAVQEAIGKIEVLETEVAALKGG